MGAKKRQPRALCALASAEPRYAVGLISNKYSGTLDVEVLVGRADQRSGMLGGLLTRKKASNLMRINLASVFVDNQEKARKFYTEVLGFVEKHAVPVGEFLWLTVVSPEDLDGTELLLEPNDNPAAQTFQEAIFQQHIAAMSFAVEDLQREYERLKGQGVVFTLEPTRMGPVTIAVFEDTCGNLIQITQA